MSRSPALCKSALDSYAAVGRLSAATREANKANKANKSEQFAGKYAPAHTPNSPQINWVNPVELPREAERLSREAVELPGEAVVLPRGAVTLPPEADALPREVVALPDEAVDLATLRPLATAGGGDR